MILPGGQRKKRSIRDGWIVPESFLWQVGLKVGESRHLNSFEGYDKGKPGGNLLIYQLIYQLI